MILNSGKLESDSNNSVVLEVRLQTSLTNVLGGQPDPQFDGESANKLGKSHSTKARPSTDFYQGNDHLLVLKESGSVR